MKIERIRTDLFDANCYVLFSQETGKAVVVDPGVGAAARVEARLAQLGADLAAVLLTHGHADHVWEVDAVANLAGVPVPVFVPEPDKWGLDDPTAFFGDAIQADGLGLSPWVRPKLVEAVPAGNWQVTGGVVVHMVPARGHSAGSALFLLGGPCLLSGADEPFEAVALSGDVIFAGSVGRTDLVTGNEQEMRHTLRTLCNVLDPQTVLLPGHGQATQWGIEMEENPYVVRAKKIG